MRRALAVLAVAAVFGGADQYLGSLSGRPWATEVSLLSAPWLLVAFLAGRTQPRPGRAAVLGLAATVAALAGYWTMTLSPVEGAELGLRSVRGLLVSQSAILVGGVVTGPCFGWLGCRCRSAPVVVGALVAAAALCLEPLAHAAAGDPPRLRAVWGAEVAVGLALVVTAVVVSRRRGSRAPA